MPFNRLVRYEDAQGKVSYGDLLHGNLEEGFLVKRLTGDLSVGFQAVEHEEPTVIHNVGFRKMKQKLSTCFLNWPTYLGCTVSRWLVTILKC